jgi:hypothetical protein
MLRAHAIALTAVTLLGCETGPGGGVTAPPPDELGAIQVQVTTTGGGADSAGYTVVLQGKSHQRVGASGSALFTGLVPRAYVVQLSGLPRHCVADGPAVKRVTVQPADTTTLKFAVACTRPVSIRVTVNTTGAPLDPDGYTIILDGSQRLKVAVNDTVLFTDLDSPVHNVQLTDVAANCWFTENSFAGQTAVQPADGDTASVPFDLACVAGGVATINVEIHLTGDPFGYALRPYVTSSDGSTRVGQYGVFQALPAGTYEVGVAGGVPFRIQCTVAGANPRTILLHANTSILMVFEVHCVDD